MVSPLHGNFVVNMGAARATDVLALIEEVRAEVAQQTGIELELEVKRWLD
jgi:UDP-N-acetylmuramate dehydrogenase